jgi:NADPH2:quinone reductase
MMVSFGNASGPVEPVTPLELASGGSLYLTRPNLAHYMLDRAEFDWRTSELFELLSTGALSVRIDSTYPLADASKAHVALASRSTAGKLLLLP